MNSGECSGLFFDRDGTLIVDKNYLADPEGVELIPGAHEALLRARDSGARLFLFTNQSGVGRGWYTLGDVEACNRRMLELLGMPDAIFSEICIATEAPDQPDGYRKPSPRFIHEMVAKYRLDPRSCFIIGDRHSDMEAGLNAGISACAVRSGAPMEARLEALIRGHQIPMFEDVNEALKTLLNDPVGS